MGESTFVEQAVGQPCTGFPARSLPQYQEDFCRLRDYTIRLPADCAIPFSKQRFNNLELFSPVFRRTITKAFQRSGGQRLNRFVHKLPIHTSALCQYMDSLSRGKINFFQKTSEKSMKRLTNQCPFITIPKGNRNDHLRTIDKTIGGNIWTRKSQVGKMMFEYVLKKDERLDVRFVMSKKERVKLPKGHCRNCHYTWTIRKEDPPDKCPNYNGYTDSEGKFHEKCGSRHWDEWPSNLDPASSTCETCLLIYYQEKAEAAEEKQNQIRAVNG